MFVFIAIHFAVANRQGPLGDTHSLGFTSHSCLRGHADVRPCLTTSLVPFPGTRISTEVGAIFLHACSPGFRIIRMPKPWRDVPPEYLETSGSASSSAFFAAAALAWHSPSSTLRAGKQKCCPPSVPISLRPLPLLGPCLTRITHLQPTDRDHDTGSLPSLLVSSWQPEPETFDEKGSIQDTVRGFGLMRSGCSHTVIGDGTGSDACEIALSFAMLLQLAPRFMNSGNLTDLR